KVTAVHLVEKTNSRLTPLVQCVRKARPSTVIVNRAIRTKVIGTGVVVDTRGYVITNRHVVGDEKAVTIRILASENKVHKGEVVWADADQDLALIRILTPGKYTPIQFADSDALEVGEATVAIGNPFGFTGTVTRGIVSALNRAIPVSEEKSLSNLIQ